MKNNGIGLLVFYVALVLTLLVGEIKCIYKAINCNWEPIGKAEIIYTACSFVPPVGAIVGWIDIKDK
jgi:hypothetical protein